MSAASRETVLDVITRLGTALGTTYQLPAADPVALLHDLAARLQAHAPGPSVVRPVPGLADVVSLAQQLGLKPGAPPARAAVPTTDGMHHAIETLNATLVPYVAHALAHGPRELLAPAWLAKTLVTWAPDSPLTAQWWAALEATPRRGKGAQWLQRVEAELAHPGSDAHEAWLGEVAQRVATQEVGPLRVGRALVEHWRRSSLDVPVETLRLGPPAVHQALPGFWYDTAQPLIAALLALPSEHACAPAARLWMYEGWPALLVPRIPHEDRALVQQLLRRWLSATARETRLAGVQLAGHLGPPRAAAASRRAVRHRGASPSRSDHS